MDDLAYIKSKISTITISVTMSTLMVLADGQMPYLLHLESCLVYKKGHEVGHCHQLCLLLDHFFVVSTLKQVFKECKTFDFPVFLQTYHWPLHSKEVGWTIGRIGKPEGLPMVCSMENLYRVSKLIRLSHFIIY